MWFDEIADSTRGKQVINDSKTPSGRVHVGSLRGVLLHDAIFRALKAQGREVVYRYGVDDFDPLDGLPSDATEELKSFMGFPLCDIPPPPGSSATDMADHYIGEFLDVFRDLGVAPTIYRMRDIYRSGRFNEAIDKTLKSADKVREVYLKVSNARKSVNWHPFQVVCETCGRIGTTEVVAYDGREVEYICQPDMVKWARGCGHHGKTSPFDGNGKLPWKLEWPAKWYTFGITIEGAGKDHCTKGGSRDVADACFRAIYGGEPPLNVPYEFFLVGGAKMSSSKGIGSSAREIANLLPAEILRFLMVRTPPRRPVNFSSELDPLVKLFNDYDRLVDRSLETPLQGDEAAILGMSQSSPGVIPGESINFQLLTALLQLPHIDVLAEVRRRLEIPVDGEIGNANSRRIETATKWLNEFATADEKLVFQETLPESAQQLGALQRFFLRRLGAALRDCPADENAIQSAVFDVARTTPLSQPDAFSAVYKILFARDKGPKVGAILSFLDRRAVMERFRSLPFSVMEALTAGSVDIEEFEKLSAAEVFGSVGGVVCSAALVVSKTDGESNTDGARRLQGKGFVSMSWSDGMSRRHVSRVRFSEFDGVATTEGAAARELQSNAEQWIARMVEAHQGGVSWEKSPVVIHDDSRDATLDEIMAGPAFACRGSA